MIELYLQVGILLNRYMQLNLLDTIESKNELQVEPQVSGS